MHIKGTVKITGARNGQVIKESPVMENLVVLNDNRGANLILKRLGGTNTYSLNITHADLGTGDAAPNVNDEQLVSAESRAVALKTAEDLDSVTFRFFYPDGTLPNDTYKEFGTFIDGGSTVNTGRLWNRLVFDIDYEKETGEDTTVILTLEVNT